MLARAAPVEIIAVALRAAHSSGAVDFDDKMPVFVDPVMFKNMPAGKVEIKHVGTRGGCFRVRLREYF
jgi:phosphoribosylcarboxyaminoimidazole (NCAIR) mutase